LAIRHLPGKDIGLSARKNALLGESLDAPCVLQLPLVVVPASASSVQEKKKRILISKFHLVGCTPSIIEGGLGRVSPCDGNIGSKAIIRRFGFSGVHNEND